MLPVKCEECSFHYTTRSSLSKHIEKKRCSKNKEHVKYAEAKIEKRRIKKLKNLGLNDATKIEPNRPEKSSGETAEGGTEVSENIDSKKNDEKLKVKQNENESEFRKIEIEMVKEWIHGPIPFFRVPFFGLQTRENVTSPWSRISTLHSRSRFMVQEPSKRVIHR